MYSMIRENMCVCVCALKAEKRGRVKQRMCVCVGGMKLFTSSNVSFSSLELSTD